MLTSQKYIACRVESGRNWTKLNSREQGKVHLFNIKNDKNKFLPNAFLLFSLESQKHCAMWILSEICETESDPGSNSGLETLKTVAAETFSVYCGIEFFF